MRSILVLRGGALGDFIVTLPALAALRTRWPSARLELAGNATAAALARARGLLDAVHSQHEARWSSLYGSAPLPPDFADWLHRFDLVVSFWPDPDGELTARFPLHPAQRFLAAPAMPTCAPAARHYTAALAPLGIQSSDTWTPLVPLLASLPSTSSPRAGLIVHPGSGSPRKNWPLSRWLELLPQLPPPLTLVLGEVELAAPTWSTVALPPHTTVLRAPPLEELVARLSAAARFVGHDSGISHLAAACGTPSLLLFGPTDPTAWAPPASHVQVLQRGQDLASLAVDDVLQALALPLPAKTITT